MKKTKPDGSKTIYVGRIYEVDKNSGGAVTRTVTYYPAGGAMRIDNTLYFILKDRLGSAYATTNASGNVVGEMRYYAFGETRLATGTIFTDKLFTGQREMADLGIYHYGARFFSPKLGRFLSADSMVPNLFNPQDLNRYTYVNNSPTNYTDPSGRCYLSGHWIPDTDAACQWASNNQDSLSGSGNGGFVSTSGSGGGGNDPNSMNTSPEGVDFIIHWEGNPPPLYPYVDMGGTCTIGYGHVLYNPDREGCSGWPNKTYGNTPLTMQGALDFLNSDLEIYENLIRRTITVDLTQAQFDALVSYTFNSGDQPNQPYYDKGIPELINSGNYEAAAAAIASGPITSGDPPLTSNKLIERRQAEAYLFLNGIYLVP